MYKRQTSGGAPPSHYNYNYQQRSGQSSSGTKIVAPLAGALPSAAVPGGASSVTGANISNSNSRTGASGKTSGLGSGTTSKTVYAAPSAAASNSSGGGVGGGVFSVGGTTKIDPVLLAQLKQQQSAMTQSTSPYNQIRVQGISLQMLVVNLI